LGRATGRGSSRQPFSLYGIKFWADGSNQAESAAQTKPYLHSALKGDANYTPARMTELCRAVKDAGWPILIHCQGDAAVDDALMRSNRPMGQSGDGAQRAPARDHGASGPARPGESGSA